MLKHLVDKVLIEDTEKLVMIEKKTTAEILKHLEEIDRRKLYADYGYPSLIKFCVHHFKYSEGAAYRRIQAARLTREIPEALPLLAQGKLTLTNLAKVKVFATAENIKDSATKKDLVRQILNKTTKETEDLLLKKARPNSTFRRKNKCLKVTSTDWELTVTLSESTKQNLDKIKNLKSHSILNYEQLFEFLAIDYLKRNEKLPKIKREKTTSRCATVNQRKIILAQAEGRCQWVHPTAGNRCEGYRFLQLDHIKPARFGGKTEISNLQVLCSSHNLRKSFSSQEY